MRTDFHDQMIIGRTGRMMHTYILPSELHEVIQDLVNIYCKLFMNKPIDCSLTDDELEKYYP